MSKCRRDKNGPLADFRSRIRSASAYPLWRKERDPRSHERG
jgi:hypothetical protein